MGKKTPPDTKAESSALPRTNTTKSPPNEAAKCQSMNNFSSTKSQISAPELMLIRHISTIFITICLLLKQQTDNKQHKEIMRRTYGITSTISNRTYHCYRSSFFLYR